MTSVRGSETRSLLGIRMGWRNRKNILDTARLIFSYLLVTALALVFSLPFYWMLSTSLKSQQQLAIIPAEWFPNPIRWQNYVEALTSPTRPFYLALRNTVMYTLVGGFGMIASSLLIAYGFARLEFDGRDFMFLLVLSTMMLPAQVTLIPQYLLFKELGWLDSYRPLIVPKYFGSAFYVFLLRQFFMTIPRELDEAALMDGANRFMTFWKIILPVSKPIIFTVVAFTFIAHWNDFFGPLIYLDSVRNYLLSLWLALFRVDPTHLRIDYVMAGSVVITIPVMAVFLQCQRYFITGITMTGMAGT